MDRASPACGERDLVREGGFIVQKEAARGDEVTLLRKGERHDASGEAFFVSEERDLSKREACDLNEERFLELEGGARMKMVTLRVNEERHHRSGCAFFMDEERHHRSG